MLTRWDPFREMLSIRNMMDRMLERNIEGEEWTSPTWGLTVDAYETDNEFVVKASVPGINPDDIDITYSGNTVTIKGEVKEDQEVKENRYHLRERRYGTFARSLTLPTRINADEIKASYDNGILTLHLPKAEEVRPKRIPIHASGSSKTIEGRFEEGSRR